MSILQLSRNTCWLKSVIFCFFFLSGVNGQVTWFIDSKKAVFEYIFQLHAQKFNVSLVDYRFAWWLSESDNERCL